jgi:uncharacterized protein (TIGR02594 family)
MMSGKEIQVALIKFGFDVGPSGADGDIGPDSIKAIKAFQLSRGLNDDGLAGGVTQKALQGIVDKEPLKLSPHFPPWLVLAIADIGTVEGVGANNNPKVLAYFRDAGFPGIKQDSVAWCAAFIGAQLERSGFKPSGSLAARSYETWGVGLKAPVLGCIGVKKRGTTGWQGHVGSIVGANATEIFMVSGNAKDRVGIDAYKRSDFTAFRWPSNLPIPQNAPLPTSIAGATKATKEA